jgi:hypothetical protein
MNEIYSREQKRLALTFNVFMKVSFMPGCLIVNKIKARRFMLAGFLLPITTLLPVALPLRASETV